jgi:Asp-tRNA(Asn)/Glu-tRNA(Gln) amidotransferase A subunit family amidase
MPLSDPDRVELRGLRIAFHGSNGVHSPTDETVAVVNAAAKALSDEGSVVEEALLQGIEEGFEMHSALMIADGGLCVDRLLQEYGTAEICTLSWNAF